MVSRAVTAGARPDSPTPHVSQDISTRSLQQGASGELDFLCGGTELQNELGERERARTKRKLCHLLCLGLGNHTALGLWDSACLGSCRGLPGLRGENTDSTSDRGVTKFWKSQRLLWLLLENTRPHGYCGFSVTPLGCGAQGLSDFPLRDSVSSAVKWGC